MADRLSVVVICDGSLASLVALALEHEALSSESAATQGSAGGVGVWPATVRQGELAASRAAADRQCERFGAGLVADWPPAVGDGEDVTAGRLATADVLAAAYWAAESSVARLVWPVQVVHAEEDSRLDLASAASDRALLCSRLLSLDVDRPPAIELPFVDMTDAQVGELAFDLGVPTACCRWADASDGLLAAERTRWSAVLDSLGVAGINKG
ncbi:MAG: hypothetical protein AAF747_01050 [Planctomycetota bacterium]